MNDYTFPFPEYDLFLRISREDIHVLCYIVEGEDNLMNIRHTTENGLLKVIVTGLQLKEALAFLESIGKILDMEVVEVRENPGHT